VRSLYAIPNSYTCALRSTLWSGLQTALETRTDLPLNASLVFWQLMAQAFWKVNQLPRLE